MRKISLLFCACLLIALALVACQNTQEEPHTHTYADVWSYDEDGHWYAATCEHTQEKANVATHTDEQNDGICDVCGYGSDHKHEFAQEWSSDAENHWHAAACGHDVKDVLGAHKDENNDDRCDVCDHSGGCEHPVAADAWLSDAQTHWHGATCGHNIRHDAQAHADADNNGACDTCAWSDPDHTHTYKTEYSYDEQNHWFDADCGHTLKDGVQAHTDEDNNGACDVCPWNDGCSHAYSTLWSMDGTHHWHDVTCAHTMAPADRGEHVDENGDGVCDICEYLDHEHTYDNTVWIYDKNGHWHAATCGCSLKCDEAAHTDANNDGACDTCAWNDGCEHLPAEQWSHDAKNHWHAVSCTHSIAPVDKSAHIDPDADGVCNVCAYYNASHTHTYQSTWTIGINTHYYAASCGHTGARKEEATHTDEDFDDVCDVCGGAVSLQALLDKATSNQSAEQISGGTVIHNNTFYFDVKPTVNTETITYEFGDGYLHTNDGMYDRYFTLSRDGTVFGVRRIDGEYEAEDASGDHMLGYYFSGHFLYYSIEAYGVETLLYNLMAFAQENAYGLDGYYDAARDVYYISFIYNNGFGSLFLLDVELELSAEHVIEEMRIYSEVYSNFAEYENGSAYPAQGATPDYRYEVLVEQQIGARTAVNTHGPEVFLFESFDFADENGNLYKDTIYLDPNESVKLYYANANPFTATAKIDLVNVTCTGNSSQITVMDWYDGSCVFVKGKAAGTYTLTVATANVIKTVNIVVGKPELQSLTPQVYYKDYSGLYTTTVGNTYTVYAGQTMYFGAMANPTVANAGFTATASGGTLGKGTIDYGATKVNVSTFCATAVGTYTITLTSTEKASVKTTLTVTVLSQPSEGDILNGTYMAKIRDINVSSYYETDIRVIFAPESAGATHGTVTFIRNGSETEVMSYQYENGAIVLTHVSGDDLGYTLALNDQYSVTISWGQDGEQIMDVYNYTNRVYAEVWVSANEMIGNDMYRYQFVFGDQGYVFDGETFGYPDMLSSVDNQTGVITVIFLDSVADTELATIQSITFNPDQNTITVVFANRTVILTPENGNI